MENQATKYTAALIVVAVLFIIWGILGVIDSKNYTYSGLSTDGDNTIIKVEDSSPAANAGFQVGDVIKINGGIAVTDTKALNERDREKIGDVREYVIERNGKELTLQLTFAALNNKDKTLKLVAVVIGLIFVVLGVFAHSKVKTILSLTFAIFAICLGSNIIGGPYISNELIAKIVSAIASTVVLLSLAALVNYMLLYPPQSNFLNKKHHNFWIYGPALCLLIFIWAIGFVEPDSTSTLNQIIRLLAGVVLGGYFLVALVVLIMKFAKVNSEERKRSGLNLLLLGAIIGLVPILIFFIIKTISPKTILPGQDYIFITFIAIPILFTMAILKQDKTVAKES